MLRVGQQARRDTSPWCAGPGRVEDRSRRSPGTRYGPGEYGAPHTTGESEGAMNTMHAPRVIHQRSLGNPNRASRDGPGQHGHNVVLLAVAGLAIVALVAFAVVRFWPGE